MATGHIRQSVRRVCREWTGFLGISAILGFGVGCATVGFGVVNVLVLRPLPFAEGGRLVVLSEQDGAWRDRGSSLVALQSWKKEAAVFSAVAGYRLQDMNLTGRDRPAALIAAAVTGDFFSILGQKVHVGRLFSPREAEKGDRVVVLSYGFWMKRFAGRSDAIGQELPLGDQIHTVIGVLPADFRFLEHMPDVVVPISTRAPDIKTTLESSLSLVVAKLQPGATVAQAQSASAESVRQLAKAFPAARSGWSSRLQTLHARWMGTTQTPALMMFLAVAVLLVVACVNAAGLLLARAIGLRREIRIRCALGATRGDIASYFLAEALLVSAFAALLGTALAAAGLRGVVLFLPANVMNVVPGGASSFQMDYRIAGFATLVSVLSAVLCSCAVLLQSVTPGSAIGWRSRSHTPSHGDHKGRAALTVAQVSLSVVLLAAGGLLIKGYWLTQRTPIGFDSQNLLAMWIGVSDGRYGDDAVRASLYERIVAELASDPAVQSATAVDLLPSHEEEGRVLFAAPMLVETKGGEWPRAAERAITDNYFSTLRIPILSGRAFDSRDRSGGAPVVIVSKTLATQYYGGDALERQLILEDASGRRVSARIVGVAADVRVPRQRVPAVVVYRPIRQAPPRMAYFLARTNHPDEAASIARQLLWKSDPTQPMDGPWSLTGVLSQRLSVHRFSSALVVAFAVCALVLTGFGIYSVMTYLVYSRSNEMGIRLALGATPTAVRMLIMQRGLRLAATGVAGGLILFGLVSSAIRPWLLDVNPHDPSILGTVAICVIGVAALACAVPARRASSADPVRSLRAE